MLIQSYCRSRIELKVILFFQAASPNDIWQQPGLIQYLLLFASPAPDLFDTAVFTNIRVQVDRVFRAAGDLSRREIGIHVGFVRRAEVIIADISFNGGRQAHRTRFGVAE